MKEIALVMRDDYGYQLLFPNWEFAKNLATAYGERDGHGAYHADYLRENASKVLDELDAEAMAFVQNYCNRTASFLAEECELSVHGIGYDQQGAEPYCIVTGVDRSRSKLYLQRVDGSEQN